MLGVCSGCSRAGGVFCVLTLASSRVQFRSTSQDALGFSFVFCSFRIYQKTSPFCVGSAKNRGLYCSIQKVEVKLCVRRFHFLEIRGTIRGSRVLAHNTPQGISGVGVESLLSTHEYTEEPKQSS